MAATTPTETVVPKKVSYTISPKSSFKVESVGTNSDNLVRFASGANHFGKYFLNSNMLYNETGGFVYKFCYDCVNRIGTFGSKPWNNIALQKMMWDTSYYVLFDRTMIEFVICDDTGRVFTSKPDSVTKIKIVRSEFSTPFGDRVVAKNVDIVPIAFDNLPYLLTVANRVIISDIYSIRSEISNGKYQVLTSASKPYDPDTKSFVYKIDQDTHYTINGVVNFNVVMNQFVVVFAGAKFEIVDLKTGKVKSTINSGLTETTELNRLYVTKILVPSRISETAKEHAKRTSDRWNAKNLSRGKSIGMMNEITSRELTTNGKCIVTCYEIKADDVYKPEPNECVRCYTDIKLDVVVVPCGNRHYCEQCAMEMHEKRKPCVKCGVDVTNHVKIVL